ncbi:serine hydrolase [Peribacillus frigoritolerans]|uniref:serine hydrolase n=1 Tax=Peribacillus frigoritolerans TaxID=450367 RepID=UPI0010598706|nr:serine hydrolase [Peribacillus frigoritolerans]TDL80364.1 serine hydrolase [Peribacillus frigoritolerans]
MTVNLKLKLQEVIDRCPGKIGLAIVLDGEIIEWNSNGIFSSASLIKLPILLTAFRLKDRGILALNEKVNLRDIEKTGGAGVLQSFSDDAVLTVSDLLSLMIIVSDNAATNYMIYKASRPAIHACMKDLNLTSTELNRDMMDLEAIKNGLNNWTTADDMLKCLKAIGEDGFLTEVSRKQIEDILQKQQFTDKLPYHMDTDKVYAGNKTGELPGIEHDCAIIRFGDRTAYAAVLIDQLQNKEAGRRTISEIGKLIYDELLMDNQFS